MALSPGMLDACGGTGQCRANGGWNKGLDPIPGAEIHSFMRHKESRTPKLLPKLVMVASALAWPRTESGNISPTNNQLMGPKLTCRRPYHAGSLFSDTTIAHSI